jgi:hypothetical protein
MAETIKQTVMRVLAGQSEGYLIDPGATAFRVEGLSEEDVAKTLAELGHSGHAREDEVVGQNYTPALDDDGEEIPGQIATDPTTGEPILVDAVDEDGKTILIDSGWTITDKGLAAHKRRRK